MVGCWTLCAGLDGCDQARDRRAGNANGLYSSPPAAQEYGTRGVMVHQQQPAQVQGAVEVRTLQLGGWCRQGLQRAVAVQLEGFVLKLAHMRAGRDSRLVTSGLDL